MAVIPQPDPDDPLKVRRLLAFACVFFALVIFPVFIAIMCGFFMLDEKLALQLIIYEGAISSGPLVAYLVAAQKLQSSESKKDQS